ncbi:hypothetical protein PsWM33_05149 [Pseudovibrio sp. WM33]|nr:hypothetical protein PsWM33_05149 [Pseudovibrio sp. WM33]
MNTQNTWAEQSPTHKPEQVRWCLLNRVPQLVLGPVIALDDSCTTLLTEPETGLFHQLLLVQSIFRGIWHFECLPTDRWAKFSPRSKALCMQRFLRLTPHVVQADFHTHQYTLIEFHPCWPFLSCQCAQRALLCWRIRQGSLHLFAMLIATRIHLNVDLRNPSGGLLHELS